MFLKRTSVLALGVFLFIGAYLLFFHFYNRGIEDEFRRQRQAFRADDISLTAPAAAPALPPAPPAPASAPAENKPVIGPMPPPSSTFFSRPIPAGLVAALLGQIAPREPETVPPATAQTSPPLSPALAPVGADPAHPTPLLPNTPGVSPRPVAVEASVIVLGYHQFMAANESSSNIYKMKASTFADEMRYLRENGYHVIPLADVVRFIKNEIGLPPNAVAITIDDGYKSAINYAAPILKEYGYPWTYFVYPEFITENESKGAASWNDLLALQKEGVSIESHSMTHPILPSHTQKWKGSRHHLTEAEYDAFLTRETAGSKVLLEQRLGVPVRYLAYPYGEYNKAVEAKAVAAGYEAIFTVANNPVHRHTSLISIGRYIITQPVERSFSSFLRQGALTVANATPPPGGSTSERRPIISATLSYAGILDPKTIEATVRDFGVVHSDYDPQTSTIRLYLPRDLVQPTVNVNIRAKDSQSNQMMVANWRFNYEPAPAAVPIAPPLGSVPGSTAPSEKGVVTPAPLLSPK